MLAIDKQGSLVLIENKLDDTGRDVTWQALKYASYCSSLSKEVVRRIYQEFLDKSQPGTDAKILLTEFLEAEDYEEIQLNKGFTQRIMLIAFVSLNPANSFWMISSSSPKQEGVLAIHSWRLARSLNPSAPNV